MLASTSELTRPEMRTTYYGADVARFIGQRALVKLPTEIETSALWHFQKIQTLQL